jgi:formylglycine-generating enzyme required for sulfatase activity
LLFSPTARAVNIDWVTVGDPGNACDPQGQGCFGAVGYVYRIGKYEVTNAQYTEFLNAKAAADPLDLYKFEMGSGFGGITRSGNAGGYTYNAIAGRADMPVNYVSFFDGLRFANWLHNGQADGDTETGAYTLLGGTPRPSNTYVTRNAGASIFVPSEDEWYKAAYYDGEAGSYFDYPAGTDTPIVCAAPGATANTANCGSVVGDLTKVGSYTSSASAYGTFDQGGNLYEWNETLMSGDRGLRGGAFRYSALSLGASGQNNSYPTGDDDIRGFRVASVPEPGTGPLLVGGVLGLSILRRSCLVRRRG